MSTLSPNSVLITGANRGLGLEFVKQFLRLPQPPKFLFACCRNPDNAAELIDMTTNYNNVNLVKVDVRNDADISAAVIQVEKIVGEAGLNLLLNNAGFNNQERTIDLLTRDKLHNHFDINVAGPMMIAKAFLPLLRMAATKGDPATFSCSKAAIVNVSTDISLIGYVDKRKDLRYPYCTAKCALNMATSILANETAKDGILVALLYSGWVKTDMGGPMAILEIPDAISQCMEVFASLNGYASGRMITHDGIYKSWEDAD